MKNFKLIHLWKGWLRGDWPNTLFLASSLILVGVLTWYKIQINNPIEDDMSSPCAPAYSNNLQLSHSSHALDSHRFYLSSSPITNAQYHHFTSETGYFSAKERSGLYPYWEYPNLQQQASKDHLPSWITEPDLPVLWLLKEDAERFCIWLSEKKSEYSPYLKSRESPFWKGKGFRLPTLSELNAAFCNTTQTEKKQHWEWTASDYSEVQKKGNSYKDYLALWKFKTSPKFRRRRDILSSNEEPVTFHIAWTDHSSI
jgi:hypothetical protein